MFSLILGIVFTSTSTASFQKTGKQANLKQKKIASAEYSGCSSQQSESKITCIGVNLNEIETYLNKSENVKSFFLILLHTYVTYVYLFQKFNNFHLVIKTTNFENDIIRKGWLNSDQNNELKILHIENCGFRSIEKGVFSSEVFPSLNELVLVIKDKLHLQPDIFDGVKRLTTLYIRANIDGIPITIENNALKFVSDTLQIFQMQRLINGVEQVNSLFGQDTVTFSKVCILLH